MSLKNMGSGLALDPEHALKVLWMGKVLSLDQKMGDYIQDVDKKDGPLFQGIEASEIVG